MRKLKMRETRIQTQVYLNPDNKFLSSASNEVSSDKNICSFIRPDILNLSYMHIHSHMHSIPFDNYYFTHLITNKCLLATTIVCSSGPIHSISSLVPLGPIP